MGNKSESSNNRGSTLKGKSRALYINASRCPASRLGYLGIGLAMQSIANKITGLHNFSQIHTLKKSNYTKELNILI